METEKMLIAAEIWKIADKIRTKSAPSTEDRSAKFVAVWHMEHPHSAFFEDAIKEIVAAGNAFDRFKALEGKN
jgi:hypothetical protein